MTLEHLMAQVAMLALDLSAATVLFLIICGMLYATSQFVWLMMKAVFNRE